MGAGSQVIAGLLGSAIGCVAYGTFVEAVAYRIQRFTLPVLPSGSRPVRLLHISDIHLAPRQPRKEKFLQSLADEEPDVVVNTGDNLSSATVNDALAAALAPLSYIPGVVVWGSNDFYGPIPKSPLSYFTGAEHDLGEPDLPWADLASRVAGWGWVDVEGARHRLELPDTEAGSAVTLEFVGTGDAHIDRDLDSPAPPPMPGADVRIGVTHAPYRRVLDTLVQGGCQVLLAGHTHGGQVCMPRHGALISNCDLDPAQARGISSHEATEQSAWLHVSAGIGMSRFAPYRFACPPEATVLTLVPTK